MPFQKIHTEPMIRVNYQIPVVAKEALEKAATEQNTTPTMVLKSILYAWLKTQK